MANVSFDKRGLLSEFNSRRPSSVTIQNEDIIQEYIQAKVVGRGEEYKEFVDDSDEVSDETRDTIDRLEDDFDASQYKSVDEVEQEINKVIHKIYSRDKMAKAIDKMETETNKQLVTDGGTEQKLQQEFGTPDVVIDTIDKLKRLLKLFVGVLAFGGVAVAMILKVASRSAIGAGMIMLCMAPVALLGTAYHGNVSAGIIYTAVSATAAIGGGIGMKGFDAVAKTIDDLYMEWK